MKSLAILALDKTQTWLHSSSDHLSIPLAFLHSTLDGNYCPSTISAHLSFTSEYLYFNIFLHWTAAQGPTVETLLSLKKHQSFQSDPENHLRQSEKPAEWHQIELLSTHKSTLRTLSAFVSTWILEHRRGCSSHRHMLGRPLGSRPNRC